MKLGIVLPNQVPWGLTRGKLLDFARIADQAGFQGLATIDKPNYDGWDPLPTLAAAAAVTERIRLATTILQLPNRNAVEVAKQAAMVDVLSNGRLELGVAVGGREDDFEVYGASFHDRGKRFSGQVAEIRETWNRARRSTVERGELGPAPTQDPLPIIIGGMVEKTIARAIEIGDGYVFGTAGAGAMASLAPGIRERARLAGKPDFRVDGLDYVALGEDPSAALVAGAAAVLRYYGFLWSPPEQMIHHGPAESVAEDIRAYEDAGLDVLYLWPQINDPKQVEMIREGILPRYA